MDNPSLLPPSPAVALVQEQFLRCSEEIRGFIRAMLPDSIRADDVFQETFLIATRKAADFEPDTNFTRWACSIARFKVMDERRAISKTAGVLSAETMEALMVTEEAFSWDPRIDHLPECMNGLPEGMRHMIKLRYYQDHTPAEIASLVGWTPNSVYVALSRARALLRECLESRPPSPVTQ
jgi:RNA polymerase sigma-70 factor (ECF subfamily)